jgi:hypothetical protein
MIVPNWKRVAGWAYLHLQISVSPIDNVQKAQLGTIEGSINVAAYSKAV